MPAVEYERTITAVAAAAPPERELTPAERAHLGLPVEQAPTEEEER